MNKTAVIIIHFKNIAVTRNSLKSLSKKIGSHSLYLINNTADDVSSLMKIIPNTSLIQNKSNLGFATAINQGIALALTDDAVDSVFVLNNDAEFAFGNINILRKTLFQSSATGIVTPVLRYNADTYDWGGKLNKLTGNIRHINFKNRPKKPLNVNHASAASMLIKRTLIDQIGPFDERFFMYFEDSDYCIRAREIGYRIIIDPEVVVDHMISNSSTNQQKIMHLWRAHLQFILKHMPRKVYPTAIIYDLLYFPILFYRSLLIQLLRR